MTDNKIAELLNNNSLSEAERQEVLRILGEVADTGTSPSYVKLLKEDFNEIPVDIMTFIKDRRYLGNAWYGADGSFKMYPYWQEVLQKLFPNNIDTAVNNVIESGARGLGKAQPLDSLVLCEGGYKQMGEMQVGDQVYGRDGKLHEVVGVFPQGEKPTYRITFSDKTSTLCAGEHLWTVQDRKLNNKEVTLTTEELLENGLVLNTTPQGWKEKRYRIPLTAPIEFEAKETLISPYMMGCLLGDGCFSEGVTFTTNDPEIKLRLEEEITKHNYSLSESGFLSWYIKNNEYTRGGISTPNIYKDEIIRLGLWKKRSWEKHIPDEYKYGDVQARIDLLQGLMDTDGEVNKSYQEMFTTVSKQLAEDVIFIVQSLGGTAILKHNTSRKYKYKGEERDCRDTYAINIKLPKNILPCSLDRKLENLNPKRLNPSRRIVSIEYVGEQECQCIYINSEDHLYMTNDCILTHNSEIGITIGAYLMYRVMCLKNPHDYFHLKPTEKIAFAFMNITKYLAEGIGITKFQNTIQMSPWFMERGTITGTNVKVWNPPDYIDIIIGSQSSHVIGQPIFFAMFDEIDFIKNQDIDRQKQIAMDMIDTAIGGMKTRFIHKGKNPTVLVLASSKRSDKSFLEEHMKKKLADEGESKNTLIVDEPVWNVKPADAYCGKKFNVGLGNKFLASEIMPDDADVIEWQNKGYKIIQVPVEFRAEFVDNIDRALCDFAGIAASELSKYISAMRLNTAKSEKAKNLFVKDIIEVGNSADDTTQYYDFIDQDRIDPVLKSRPLYIHLDMSISGDKTGIAGVWIIGKKPSLNNDSRELYFQVAFYVSVKAPKGYQVSFAKNREFIYWLKEQGFNIQGVSTDTYQNATIAQELTSKGYDYSIISVDRVNSDRICEPYQFLKNTIYEERIVIPMDSPLLTEELLGLERNGNSGKIDHPDGGRFGSKDSADAVCGSLWNASKNAEKYNFEYGETLDVMVDVSSVGTTEQQMQQQFTVDFEEELKRVSGAFGSSLDTESQFMDFGFGAATTNFDFYMADGIII